MGNSIIKLIGISGYSGIGGTSGYSGYSGSGISGYSGYSGIDVSGYSGYSGSGISGYSGTSTSGYSGYSGVFPAWSTWSPSITWGGTTPTVYNDVYRYCTIGKIVFLVIYFEIDTSGGACTSASIPLPVTQVDVEVYLAISAKTIVSTTWSELDKAYIDATSTSGKLELGGFSVTTTLTTFMVEGFYEK